MLKVKSRTNPWFYGEPDNSEFPNEKGIQVEPFYGAKAPELSKEHLKNPHRVLYFLREYTS